MKQLSISIFVISFCLFGLSAKAQERVEPSQRVENDQLNGMINEGFQTYIQSLTKDLTGSAASERLEKYSILTDDLPEYFEFTEATKQLNVKFLSLKRLPMRMKTKMYICFGGIRLENNRLEIYYAEHGVKVKMWKSSIGMADGWRMIYEYSCEKNKWVLIKKGST